MVHNENPVALVLTPELVRIVERASGEVLQQIFIRDIPFTLEAPGRQVRGRDQCVGGAYAA